LHFILQVYYTDREILNFTCDRYIKYSILVFINLCYLLLAFFLKSFFFISRSSRARLFERNKKYIKIVIFVTFFVKNLQLLNIITSLYQSTCRNIVRKIKQFIDLAITNCRNTKQFIDLRIASCRNTKRFIDLTITSRRNTRQFFNLRINSCLIFDLRSFYYFF